jgi:hypothetical protein
MAQQREILPLAGIFWVGTRGILLKNIGVEAQDAAKHPVKDRLTL